MLDLEPIRRDGRQQAPIMLGVSRIHPVTIGREPGEFRSRLHCHAGPVAPRQFLADRSSQFRLTHEDQGGSDSARAVGPAAVLPAPNFAIEPSWQGIDVIAEDIDAPYNRIEFAIPESLAQLCTLNLADGSLRNI